MKKDDGCVYLMPNDDLVANCCRDDLLNLTKRF